MAKSPENKSKDVNVRRKTGVVRLSFKSESTFLYMRSNQGSILNNAMYRMAELFKLTSTSYDKVVFNQIKEWFDTEIIEVATKEIESLRNQLTELQNEVDTGLEFINVKNPNMTLDFDVIHKSHGEIFNIVSKIDFLMDDIETLLLTGIDDDDDIEGASRNQMNLILNNISKKIFTVTKPGKRNGGPFNTMYFVQQLKLGVFSLYPEKNIEEQSIEKTDITNAKSTEESLIKEFDKGQSDIVVNQNELAEAV
ncbi:hypothetical protein [Shewanella aestuarii]|uniref:DUF1845 domain-containing protein n=1 Tax=Shewanella aestuarii TaxID=1028752 RepID=A0A6G9QQQ5_9GAMM|nr:hypothetical protein [Shewanella aestuarii]QIR16433.1 hypothetical protein HBH39_18345 [Shewanella aestuarii]